MPHHVSIAFAGSVAALLLALPATVEAAISVNTASGPSGWVTGNGATNITFSTAFSFAPGANGMLMVTVSGEVTPGSSTVTYDGTAMTLAVSTNRTGTGNGSYASVWYLPNPALGNGALVVTTGGSVSRYNVYAVYATGVKQAAPEAVAGNTNVSALVFETDFVNPSAGALVVTTLGSSVNANSNPYNSLIFEPWRGRRRWHNPPMRAASREPVTRWWPTMRRSKATGIRRAPLPTKRNRSSSPRSLPPRILIILR